MRRRLKTLLPATLLLSTAVALGASATSPTVAATANLSNGCTHSARGVPTCGAYVGGAYHSNDVSSTAKADVAKHRVPWMSFSAPYSWSDMAAGRGDAWARDLATKMKAVNGPVWVAVAHEPEGDGDMQKWKAMQAHLAPIMRGIAPNLGYTIILMGYHELYGAAKYRLSVIWPKTTIDVAGFDIYEKYGVQKSGQPMITTWKDIKGKYFAPLSAWAKSTGVAWGLAETGYSDRAAVKDNLKSYHGIAFSYFNTTQHSQAVWELGIAAKRSAFTSVNKSAPTLR